MGSQNGSLLQQEMDHLLAAYASIQDEHIRYFFSMMLQSVAAALAEAQGKPAAKSRQKQRVHLAA